MSSHETQLCTLKWHEQYHANFQHLFSSKTPRIVIGLNENFPFALQMGLEEMLGKESSPVSHLDGGGWVSSMWLRRRFANIPFGTTIPVITECEDLIISNLMNDPSCSIDQYGVCENLGSQQKRVYLTPSLQWTLSPGNFLREQVWTESWLNDQELYKHCSSAPVMQKTGPAFVRKDKLKSRACSLDKDNLSHHHHQSLSSQLTWFQEICFVDLLYM